MTSARASSDHELNAVQQKLFTDHLYIVERSIRIFLKSQRRFYPRDEVRSAALEGLAYAAWLWRPEKTSRMEFGAFATRQVNWTINGYFFGRNANSPGSKASRGAAAFDIPGSTPIKKAKDDSEASTVLDLAAEQVADRELTSYPGDDRLASRLCELRETIRTLKTLTSRERRVLKLRFEIGLDLESIAARIELSVPVVKRAIRSAVRKLRAHFVSLGRNVLPLDAPIPNAGNLRGCPRSVRALPLEAPVVHLGGERSPEGPGTRRRELRNCTPTEHRVRSASIC